MIVAVVVAIALTALVTPYKDGSKLHLLLLRKWWVPPAAVATLWKVDSSTGKRELEFYAGPNPWWPLIAGEALALFAVTLSIAGRVWPREQR
jgi:hypothetical protein